MRLSRKSHLPCCRCEILESRLLLSTDTWNSSGGGSWSTAANWSTGLPQPGDSVVINQPGNIKITLTGSASVGNISITGDTLAVSGGTLALASSSTIGASATLTLTNANLTLAAAAMLTNSGS